MKNHAIASVCVAVALTLVIGSATAGVTRPTTGERTVSDPDRPQTDPQPQPRRWCEQVGSGLWDCVDEFCTDWDNWQSSCQILTYHKDGEDY